MSPRHLMSAKSPRYLRFIVATTVSVSMSIGGIGGIDGSLPLVRASREEAARQLADQLLILERSGFRRIVAAAHGSLAAGRSSVHEVELVEGVIYAIVVGGCDEVVDVDIAVHGPNGVLIGGDNERAGRASLVLFAQSRGTYRVTVTMWESKPGGAHFSMVVAR